MKRDDIVAFFFVLSGLAVMVLGMLTRASIPISESVGEFIGSIIFLLGMAVFFWAASYLRGAFMGKVSPVTDHLVVTGPYRWVRHPLYLGMIITLLGLVIAFRSVWGLLSVFILFMPAMLVRARLEGESLSEKFGDAWDVYESQTHFLIPFLW